ncbi:hypothetical protein GHT09_000775 [Marmota monax]|uniref:Uncharacterized protein n=1 Tax=Marmota monax TaxID=9995 RepID=A0A834Q2I8_MARMO|nr:hypothetical protein GHT09_000775 [Marmota monax]
MGTVLLLLSWGSEGQPWPLPSPRELPRRVPSLLGAPVGFPGGLPTLDMAPQHLSPCLCHTLATAAGARCGLVTLHLLHLAAGPSEPQGPAVTLQMAGSLQSAQPRFAWLTCQPSGAAFPCPISLNVSTVQNKASNAALPRWKSNNPEQQPPRQRTTSRTSATLCPHPGFLGGAHVHLELA